ncbi:cytochrome P450 [Streptomyces sp. NPDC058423]|uniref:cytochrome P450 n=1 Tax=unclassified Streptomyces TaxID=2593676 RepID=UPI00365868F6
MTTPHHEPTGTATAPPPGCPAHAGGLNGLRRLFGPEAEQQPYAFYETLRREHGPVAPVLLYGDIPVWLVLGHRENLEVMRSPRFSSDSRHWRAVQEGRLAPDSPLVPMTAWQPLVAFMDGEEHARLRSAVTESLERVNRHSMRRYINRYANQLIDGFAARGQADLVADYAKKLPALVVAQQFGIREEHALALGNAVADMISGSENALQSNAFIVEIMTELVERKKKQPGNDFASWLIRHDSGLDDVEAVQHLRHALVASLENCVNLIANTLRVVLTDRRFRGSLSGGQMTLPDALEQVLWDHPPLAVVPTRWAVGDTVLGGKEIRAGDMVMLGLAAGNVDPAMRPDLDAPVHGNRSHLSFGAGAHECPGQDIGRAIADTGIDLLLSRLPDMMLTIDASELQVVGNWMSRRLISLPVGFTPHRRADHTGETALPGVGAALPPIAMPEPPAPRQEPRRPAGRRSGLLGWLRRR